MEPTDFDGQAGYIDLRWKIRKFYDVARDTNGRASAAQKLQHDKHVNSSNLQLGEVFSMRPTARLEVTPKLTSKFGEPYMLSCIFGKNGLIGATIPGCGKTMWVHLDHLKRACSRKLTNFD